jgi:3-oxoadipate enol-lactonase/4-carboxymuconolactone decarboxylase
MIPVLRATVDPTTSISPAVPLLVLGPSLGTTAEVWADAARLLTTDFRVVRWDLPGHGRSPATTQPFSVAELAEGVIALVDSLGGGRFAYAGVSLGGAVGLELALGPAADRLDGLAVICSAARIGEPGGWRDRALQVRQQGTASVVAGSSERWFARDFLSREPDRVGRMLNELLDVDDESYALCCEALAGFDRRADLGRIAVPTMVVSGDSDPVVTATDASATAEGIRGARWIELPETGHQAEVERPDRLVHGFRRHFAAPDRFDAGLAVRRDVLGPDYVDAAVAGMTPTTADFQRFITETAWGTIWTRPGLDRRMRSAVTISSLVTGHHWHELELHLRAGLRNGLTREELVEILLQTAIYAGVPAANSAFGVAKRVLDDPGPEARGER